MTRSIFYPSYPGAIVAAVLLVAACGAGTGPQAQARPVLGVERVFPNLGFTNPVAMLQAPNDGTRWFVIEQAGRVRVFANDPQATASGTFVDIAARVTSGGETGLLGMAFHPRFPADPRVFLSYTAQSLESRISEFTSGDGGATFDPGSERVLIVIVQPESNHNGGQVGFGPDGFLYIGMGDGGGGNDQHGSIGNGQLMTTLLGKMLRIDVSPASGYAIPPGNVFPATNPQCGTNGTGTQNCPEIFASGFRNPWRWSFDRQTGELWVGDVGQNALEEINRVVRGGNYGWRCFEGTRNTELLPCGSEPNLQPPVAEYGRSAGRSVTGGYVYRGARIAALSGRYVFGDYVTGRIWHIAGDTPPTVLVAEGYATGLNISSFGEANNGELYVVHHGGQLYRLTGS